MSDIGKSERATQNRVIALFLDELDYRTAFFGSAQIRNWHAFRAWPRPGCSRSPTITHKPRCTLFARPSESGGSRPGESIYDLDSKGVGYRAHMIREVSAERQHSLDVHSHAFDFRLRIQHGLILYALE